MRKNKKKPEKKTDLLIKSITGALELPKEITLNLPLISLTGNEELLIENHKGIIEYTGEKIRISLSSSNVLKIEGKRLVIKHVTSESIAVAGNIRNFEFIT